MRIVPVEAIVCGPSKRAAGGSAFAEASPAAVLKRVAEHPAMIFGGAEVLVRIRPKGKEAIFDGSPVRRLAESIGFDLVVVPDHTLYSTRWASRRGRRPTLRLGPRDRRRPE